MLLYRNNLATTTAPKGIGYVPVRKINIFVDMGLVGLHTVFSPVISLEISKLSKILTFETYISEKKSSPLFGADRKKQL